MGEVLLSSDTELLRKASSALCASTHSRFARLRIDTAPKVVLEPPGTVSPAGFNVFVVFGVRPCSGVLVSQWHILTSAYCTEHVENGTAFLGGTKYQSMADVRQPEVVVALVSDIRVFSGSDLHLDHDVAIGKLSRKCEPNANINHAALTSVTKWDEPREGIMMGFGETFEGDFAHVLGSATVTLECGELCSQEVPTYRLGQNALCGVNTTYAMCWGDMGGAVIDNEGKLAGLIAYKTFKSSEHQTTRLCAQKAKHIFFMSIGYYRDWINSVISASET
ncbi:snake venom serine protease CL2-like [Schistocerca cancellata]|uniref:snake venom serine protease CL2-like n=1 Tax=Schistocerca cancellata TaxID=274614 RepID=UPI002118D500|nr:snake venom serine protease CL2-like [Schistocerca cancellata]